MRWVSLLACSVVLGTMLAGAIAQGASQAVIRGTARSDDLVGTPAGDTMYGFAGNDHIAGRGGSDVMFGGPGDDTLIGGDSKDYLAGDEGNDTLILAWANRRPGDFASCGLGVDVVILQGVPEADRRGAELRYDGAPAFCESIRFR